MKKIKRKNIDPLRLITKSQYAKDNKTNPTNVQRRIDRGELTVVPVQGGELIHL